MEPNQNNGSQRKIEPINEEAILQELASTQPVAQPTTPEVQEIANPASVDIGYNLQLDPIKPVTAQPHLDSQQPVQPTRLAPPPVLGELVHDESVKISWPRLLITGGAISLLYGLLLINIQNLVAYTVAANPSPENNVVAGGFLQALPYICGLIVIFVGTKFTRKLNPLHSNVLSIATLLSAIGFSGLLNTPLNYGQPIGQAISTVLGSGAYLQYFIYVVGGVIGIIAITYLMKLLQSRITNNNLFVVIILVASLVPIGINNVVNKLQQDTYEAQNVQTASSAGSALSSRENVTQTTTPVSSSTSTTQSITYKIPVVDGSGKYNDGNISFTYPVSNAEKIGGQSESGWEYDNFPNDYTSLFTGNYATDPKTYNIVSGAELRIIYTHLQEGQYGGSTGPEIRDSVSSIFDTSAYDIKTTDGSYAFGITSSLKNLDNELFGAYFIKNMAEYEIDYNGAPADVSKYKPEFDLIVSSFKFLN